MKIKVIDTTLRDGSHAVDHTFTPEQVKAVCKGLNEGGIYCAEVGHGAGIGGSVLQYGLGLYDTVDLIKAAKSVSGDMKVGTLLVPGLGTMEDLRAGANAGLDLVRVAVHCTEGDVGAQHVRLAKELGLETIMFFMMTHMTTPEQLAEQAVMAESYGADVVYFADSAGFLTPEQMKDRVITARKRISIPIGVHTHNNIGLGVGNAIAGVEAGAVYVDGAMEGLGAGSGNGNTQAIVSVLEKMGYETGCDWYKLVEVGTREVRPLVKHSLEITGDSVILGTVGIYSSFLLHVKESSEKYNIDPKLIYEELGKRKVVGGQEDQIIEICQNILEERK